MDKGEVEESESRDTLCTQCSTQIKPGDDCIAHGRDSTDLRCQGMECSVSKVVGNLGTWSGTRFVLKT